MTERRPDDGNPYFRNHRQDHSLAMNPAADLALPQC